MTYYDGQGGVPLVLLADPRLQLRVLPLRLLDEVAVAKPRNFGLRVRVNVRLQDLLCRRRHVNFTISINLITQKYCFHFSFLNILVDHHLHGFKLILLSLPRWTDQVASVRVVRKFWVEHCPHPLIDHLTLER